MINQPVSDNDKEVAIEVEPTPNYVWLTPDIVASIIEANEILEELNELQEESQTA